MQRKPLVWTGAGPGATETRLSLAEWCTRSGLVTQAEIESCLREQRERGVSGRPRIRMSELLVERGILTRAQVEKALSTSTLVDRDGALPDDVEEALGLPERRFGKYVLLRELGRGGFGRVYLAWDTLLEQKVALKRHAGADAGPASELDSAAVESLVKEARNAIGLRHPGIVQVYDVGRAGREYFVAMEYIEGETLADLLDRRRRDGRPGLLAADPARAVRILVDVARAVHYAHARPAPVVHCDLKPANILIDGSGAGRVVDFGLARALDPRRPRTGEVSGTPAYMAPEQASGRTDLIDARTDVYGLGAVLYEFLAGRPPFLGAADRILRRVRAERPVPPSVVRKGAPAPWRGLEAELEELCLRCLEKDRAGRPAGLDAVADSLEASLGRHEAAKADPSKTPTRAPAPATPSTRTRRRVRGLRAAGLTAAFAALLAAGSALPGWVARERDAAERRRMAERIGSFVPEEALEAGLARRRARGPADPEDGGAVLLEESLRVSLLKERFQAALPHTPAVARLLGLGQGTLASSGRLGLSLRTDQGIRCFCWNQLDPERLGLLIEAALPELGSSDRLALGILLVRAGRPDEARRPLLGLRGDPLWPQATRYLRGVAP